MSLHGNSHAFWRSVAQAGYPIANHSWTHPNMTRLSYAAQLAQIQTAAAQELAITGVPMLPSSARRWQLQRQHPGRSVRAGFKTVLLWDTSDATPRYTTSQRDRLG